MIGLLGAALLAAIPLAQAGDGTAVSVPGPDGPLAGTLLRGRGTGPAVVILPGSGPTDRDGNNPLGVTAAPYRLLAEALAARGISSVRIDKRGLFGSKGAIADPNAVTIADYAADARGWAALAVREAGQRCAWLVGHSEGGLVALAAAQNPAGLCGIVLVSTPSRPLGTIMREQFAVNPANAFLLADATRLIDAIEAGRTLDPAAMPQPLPAMFPLAVQRYMIDLFAHDPAKLAASAKVPVVIVQGTRDLQVTVADAQRLKTAAPAARLVLVPGVNHVLKAVASDDRAANVATYADPSLPVAAGIVDAVALAVGGR